MGRAAQPIATSAGDGFGSKAGQEIHGWLDRRGASFETQARYAALRLNSCPASQLNLSYKDTTR
jgi:hypothetical protein